MKIEEGEGALFNIAVPYDTRTFCYTIQDMDVLILQYMYIYI